MEELMRRVGDDFVYDMLTIDTPEAARNLEAAYDAAVKRGPLVIEGPDIDERLRESEEFFRNNPNWLKEAAAKAREWCEQNGVEIPDLSEYY